jgi:diguanylate cyclase (GGDEF)-like protein
VSSLTRPRPWALESLERLRSLVVGVAGLPAGDLHASADPRHALPRLLAALTGFAIPVILLTASTQLTADYGYGELLSLCIGMLGVTGLVLAAPWHRFDEQWVLAIVGIHVVFVASLATMTGGGLSPYFALYAPLLAVAGWYLQPHLVAFAVALVAGTEIWRAAVIEATPAVPQVTIGLPFFAALAVASMFTSQRLMGALTAIRQDQLRGAAALRGVRDIGNEPDGDPIAELAMVCDRVFEATSTIVRMPESPGDEFRYPVVAADEGHAQVSVTGVGGLYAILTLTRTRAFATTEIRLLGLLAEVAGRAIDNARLIARMRTEADHDPLTGLLNRRAFDRDLASAIADVRHGGRGLGLAILDLDGFKALNDQHGHAWGDRTLETVGTWLFSQVRSADTAYRIGGDEFAVIVRGLEGPDAAREIGERLRSLADRPSRRPTDGMRAEIAVSVGIAVGEGDVSAADLIRTADAAMYEAKAAGGNRVFVRTAHP